MKSSSIVDGNLQILCMSMRLEVGEVGDFAGYHFYLKVRVRVISGVLVILECDAHFDSRSLIRQSLVGGA